MNLEITELIAAQTRSVIVMAGAGVLVESLWQIRKRLSYYVRVRFAYAKAVLPVVVTELAFWTASAVVLSSFMYYGSYGRITAYGCIAFFAGLLLWKKICCIISPWERNDEVKNLKTTARSSISKRPEKNGRKKERRSGRKKKAEHAMKPVREHVERGLSENSVSDV